MTPNGFIEQKLYQSAYTVVSFLETNALKMVLITL